MLNQSQTGLFLPPSPYGTLRSMTEKLAERERINKEHLGNFKTGFVNIDEHYLHRTGIRGKKNFVGEGTCELNDALYSNPGNNLEIELTGNESFELLTFYENSGSKVTINKDEIRFRVDDVFKVVDNQGEIVFTSNYSEQLRLPQVNNLKVKRSRANEILSYGAGLTFTAKKHLHSSAYNVTVEAENFRMISQVFELETV